MHRSTRSLPGTLLFRLTALTVFLVLGILLPIWVSGCSSPEPPPPIVFVVLDTTRADHLSSYGYLRDTTPSIRKFLTENTVRFDRMIAASNNTYCSHASMFTGLHVKSHGVSRIHPGVNPLADSFDTLAEKLRDRGYYTLGAVSSTHINPEYSGFGQGFEEFVKSTRDIDKPKQPSEETNRALLPALTRALDGNPDRPLFLFLHYFDAHFRYEPPPKFASSFEPEPISTPRSALAPVGFENNPNDARAQARLPKAIANYDGEILRSDDSLGQIFELLEERGLLEKAVVVVTADHGENLGEQSQYFNHSGLRDNVIRVPLLLKIPGVTETGATEALAHHVDLMPTLLEVAGIEKSSWPELEGQSLMPLLRGDVTSIREHAISEAVQASERMIRDDRYKLLIGSFGTHYLYDLAEDPQETRNLAEQAPDQLLRLREDLLEFLGLTTYSYHQTAPPNVSVAETITGRVWMDDGFSSIQTGNFTERDHLGGWNEKQKAVNFRFRLKPGENKGIRIETLFGPTLLDLTSNLRALSFDPRPFHGGDTMIKVNLPLAYPPSWMNTGTTRVSTEDRPLLVLSQLECENPDRDRYRVTFLRHGVATSDTLGLRIRIATPGRITTLEKTSGRLFYKNLGSDDRFRAESKTPSEEASLEFEATPSGTLIFFEGKIGRRPLRNTEYRLGDPDNKTAYPTTLVLTPEVTLHEPGPDSLAKIGDSPGFYLWREASSQAGKATSPAMLEMLKKLGYVEEDE